MANERLECRVQCFISLVLMVFFFPLGCSVPAGNAKSTRSLADCSDCIQRVSRTQRTELAGSPGVSQEVPVEGNQAEPEDINEDEDEQQTHEREEVIDLDHPEDNYHEVYASAEGIGGGPESAEEPDSVSDSEYKGALRWHTIEYQEANTRGIRDATFRNREVSAAHCHFSKHPNKDTPIFAMLVRHTARHGDLFYLGREGMAISKINTARLVPKAKAKVQLVKSAMHCVYREDQNEAGTLIFQFQQGSHGEPQFAVISVEASTQRQPTDRTMLVEDAQRDMRMGAASEVKVKVYEYVAAQSRVVGVFSSFEQALAESERAIPRGRFRLRVENTYPFMNWQTYLGAEEPEFCPAGVECR